MRVLARVTAAMGAVVVGITTALVGVPVPATALSGSSFDPGMIISDQIFYDGNAMSAAQIQSFLDGKIGTCQNGKCLNVAVLPVADRPASYSGDSGKLACAAIPGGNLPVSELIYRTQVACSISAKVILVTLQKEQGLVTSKAPTDSMLRKAMGQGCPDNGSCDSAFSGLAVQIMSGARQLSVYRAAMPNSSFNFKGPGVYNILYNPNTACGASAVNVRNYATLALYNYTPYQPNGPALANLGGVGDGCSSYGNRNFWVYFNNWFGSSVIPAGTVAFVMAAYQDVLGRTPSDSERGFWVNGMLMGATRQDVAGGFNDSDEYRLIRIDEAYRTVLGREPDASGRAWWLGEMRAGRLQPDDARRIFYTYPEYYATAGGTDGAYIDALYLSIVGRPSDESGKAYWLNVLAAKGRSTVVDTMWFSPETYAVRVTETYQVLLGRDPSDAEKSGWSDYARAKGHTAMRKQIMASDEYWARATARFPDVG